MANASNIKNGSSQAEEPIAIIGMAARFPGEGSTPEGFWNMISNARTAHRPIPAERFNAAAYYHPDPDRRGAIGVTSGFFMDEDISLFDAPFFSMTAKEANTMDPMHRWILEVAYEGLENAGIPMTSLPGSDTGCFVGCFTNDYGMLVNDDLYDTSAYAATGGGLTMLSNRVSWFFDLSGPSLSVDTACSGSLYALHLACQSIRSGEIKQAIVGGTNLLINPDLFHSLTNMRMLSKDGICHTFDDRANGYARGEAIATLVVKSLSDAIADGDTIRAVVRGTGCNQDGRTPGITMPSAQAQANLIRSTYAKAGLSLNDTAYFEAHGTGTPLGDPLELSALGATFGAARSADQPPLYVSSVKTNVGHTEGCSAMAGIMKAIMSIEKGFIAPNAEFKNLNPKLRLEEWKLALPPGTIPWPTAGVRRVSVNSFGYGGANGHVILDDAVSYLNEHNLKGNHMVVPLQYGDEDSGFSSGSSGNTSEDEDHSSPQTTKKLFAFSSFDQAGLQRLSNTWTTFLSKRLDDIKTATPGLQADLEAYVNDLAFTLGARRTVFDYRSFAIASSVTDLKAKMDDGLPKIRRAAKNDNIIMVFTGQGAQWHGMGVELVAHPVFFKSIKKTQDVLNSLDCPWNALEELKKPKAESRINSADFSQPLCTAVQVALVDLLTYWGIKAKAVVGHSSGEMGAAYAAGFISHEDAVKAAYLRGIYSAEVASRLQDVTGGMMAAGISEEVAQTYLERVTAGKAVVACVNSPSSVTLSGDKSAILELEAMLQADGKFARALQVPAAYHSHHMQVIAEDYLKAMGELKTQTPPKDAPFMFSSVNVSVVQPGEINSEYWVKNLLSPVKFTDAVKGLIKHSPSARGRRRANVTYSAVIEVGPHEALKGPLNQIFTDIDSKLSSTITYTSVLCRGQRADVTALECVGKLWSQGLKVDLAKVNLQDEYSTTPKVLGDLPAYPWNHAKGFWHEPEVSKSKRFMKAPRTDLLGMAVNVQNPIHPRWRQFLSIREQPWLEHHNITSTILFPGAGMLIMALEAAHTIADTSRKVKGVELRDVSFDNGLRIPEVQDQAVETSLEFQPHKIDNVAVDGWYRFTVFSLPSGGQWIEHCSGLISVVYDDVDEVDGGVEAAAEWKQFTNEYAAVKASSFKAIDKADFYDDLVRIGMGYGELFQNLENAFGGPNCGHGTVVIPDTKATMPFEYEYDHFIHPATLDAIFHLLFVGMNSGEPMENAMVPVNMESMFIAADLPKGAGAKYQGYTVGSRSTAREGAGSIVISDSEWSAPKIVIKNFGARNVSGHNASDVEVTQQKLFTQMRWMEDVDHFQGRAAQDVLQATGAPETQLISWLQRACHKRSDLSVLVLGHREDDYKLDIIRRFAPRVGHRDRFDQCTLIENADDLLKETKHGLESEHIVATVKKADVSQPLTEQGFEPATFDLILAGSGDQATVSELASMVRSGGWLVFHALEESPVYAGLTRVLTLSSMLAEGRSIEIASVAEEEAERFSTEVVLLEPDFVSPGLRVLKKRLTMELVARKLEVTSATLSDVKNLSGRQIISLLEVEQPLTVGFNEKQLLNFKRLCTTNDYMLWLNRSGLDFSPSTGLLRVVRTETPRIRLPHLELSTELEIASKKFVSLILDVFTKTANTKAEDLDLEFTEKEGQLFVPRLISDDSLDNELDISGENPMAQVSWLHQHNRPLKLNIGMPGALDTLIWVDDEQAAEPLGEDDVEIKVTSIPLNTTDVDVLMGNTLSSVIGREANGVITRVGAKVTKFLPGQRVVTLQNEACRTLVRQKQDLVVGVPSLAAFSSFSSPLSMVAAYLALDLARVERGDKVLIHSAAGAVGQAAIQLAQHAGAEVFVTVGSAAKKELLCQHWNVPEDHIFSSRDMTFVKGIKRMTNGEGVDVVLNTLTGEAFQQTWSCVAELGRFVDLSLKTRNAVIDTSRQISYHKLNVEQLIAKRRRSVAKALESVYRLVSQGVLGQTHPINAFSVSKTKQAVQLLQSGEHIGKVMLEFDAQAQVPMTPPKPAKLRLDPTATYIIPGGLGGLGPPIASLMVDCGAKHIVTLSRSGASTDRTKRYVRDWQDRGCRVDALALDCTDFDALEGLMDRARAEGWKIKGVIQLAMVLRDTPFENMNWDKWSGSVGPKIEGTWNLHTLLPKDLDFFVALSSVSNMIGNAGQANYCAGNAYQDALCAYRRSIGLNATSISIGLMSDVEAFVNHADWSKFLLKNPHLAPVQVKESDFLTALTACLRGSTTDGVPVVQHVICGMGDTISRGRHPGTEPTAIWATDRKFELRQRPHCELQLDELYGGASGSNKVDSVARLKSATTLAEAAGAVEFALRCHVAHAMTAEPEDIDPEKPLHAYGVDSLKAVDVRNWIFKEVKTEVSVFDILSQMTVAQLAVKIAAGSKLVCEEVARQGREQLAGLS